MRWLLLEEVLEIRKGLRARSRSRVPGPGAEISAILLLMEMMAQTGALLLGAEEDFQKDLVFAKIDDAVFEGSYDPGDSIEVDVSSENLRPEGAWMDGVIRGPRGVVGRSRFLLMSVGRLAPGGERSITFHDAFMNHFQIRDKVAC